MSHSLACCAATIFCKACSDRRCAAAMLGWRFGLTFCAGLSANTAAADRIAKAAASIVLFIDSLLQQSAMPPTRRPDGGGYHRPKAATTGKRMPVDAEREP